MLTLGCITFPVFGKGGLQLVIPASSCSSVTLALPYAYVYHIVILLT